MACDSPTSTTSFGSAAGLRSRSKSVSMDQRAMRTATLTPPLVSPSPQYVATSPAAQLIAAANKLGESASQDGVTGEIVVTSSSLTLLNGFLDHLLYNILLSAKSTRISAIRPAVAEVLRPRLAKEVVNAADEELSEYMDGTEDEELSEFRGGQEPVGGFELERSWRLIRLRCMVYGQLGDMEEEDEEDHVQQGGLDENNGRPNRFSNHIGHITPAAAIFLTSILEYIAENALRLAGENARSRASRVRMSEDMDEQRSTDEDYTLIVDDLDMEKIALNPTLGRLWRSWRKHLRVPGLQNTRSRESLVQRRRSSATARSRQSSVVTLESVHEHHRVRRISPEPPISEGIKDKKDNNPTIPADIPLPLSDNDIDEIEVPGFRAQLAIAIPARSMRPRSLIISNTPTSSTRSDSPKVRSAPPVSNNTSTHTRSQSVPDWVKSISVVPVEPTQRSSSLVSSKGGSEPLETMPEVEEPEPSSTTIHAPSGHLSIDRLTIDNARRGSLEPPVSLPSDFDGSISPVSSLHSEAFDTSHRLSQRSTGPTVPSQEGSPGIMSRITTHEDFYEISPALDPSHLPVDEKTEEGMHAATAVRNHQRNRESRSSIHSNNRRDYHDTNDAQNRNSIVETAFVSNTNPNRASLAPAARTTPLREMAAAARGSSGKESSPYGSNQNQSRTSISGESDRSLTPRAKALNNVKSGSGSISKRNSPLSATALHGVERAAVQRVTPPPNTPRDSMIGKPHRSESIGSFRERRPITSGSATSRLSTKLGGFVNLQAADNPMPTADSGAFEKTEEPADLDQLIQSDETIHFTLTPKNMREIEDPDSPRWTSVRAENADATDKPLPMEPKMGLKVITSSAGTSHELRISSPGVASPSGSSATDRPLPRKPKSPLIRSTAPRDARADVSSVRDLTNFIRSTGPDSPDPSTQKDLPPINTGTRGTRSVPNSPRVVSTSAFVGPTQDQDASEPNTPGLASAKRNRPRLEARPAATPKDTRTSDLIDFIREGPPKSGAHRIPRTVAPFRNTMDSDDFRSYTPTKDRDYKAQSSIASTHDGSTTNHSLNSYNSRTGLLESSNNRASHTPMVSPGNPPRRQSLAPPARKQRRVRDPYAIDSDDEDGLDDNTTRGDGEESLADFLRNAPPPTKAQPPKPFIMNLPQGKKQNKKLDKKQANPAQRQSAAPPVRKQRRVPDPYAIDSDDEDEFDDGPGNSASKGDREESLADFLRNAQPTAPAKPPQPFSMNLPQAKKQADTPRRQSLVPPARKQRRAPDPYAIDYDDEDEFDDDDTTAQGDGEESLADFLRNAPPPAPAKPPQPFSINQPQGNNKQPKSNRASMSMKSRIMRSASIDQGAPATKPSRSSLRSSKSAAASGTPPQIPPFPPPKQTQQQESEYQQPPRSMSNQNNRPKPRPVDEIDYYVSKKSETAELADFFKNTAPPPGPPVPTKDQNSNAGSAFSRVFMRKKKQAV